MIAIGFDSIDEFIAFVEIVSSRSSINDKLDAIMAQLDIVQTQGEHEMAALDDLEAKVTAVQGVEASAGMLLQTIHDELVAALADSGQTSARVQAVIDSLGSSSDALTAAVAANPDPAAPVPTP